MGLTLLEIAATIKVILAEILTLIRKAIRLNSTVKAQKIAEYLAENTAIVTRELFIYERCQFQLLCQGKSAKLDSIPIERWPNKSGKSVVYYQHKIRESDGFGAELDEAS